MRNKKGFPAATDSEAQLQSHLVPAHACRSPRRITPTCPGSRAAAEAVNPSLPHGERRRMSHSASSRTHPSRWARSAQGPEVVGSSPGPGLDRSAASPQDAVCGSGP